MSEATSFHDDLIAWRRTVHRHPELSFQEEKTAEFIAATLQKLGLDGQRRVGGGFGVVAEIKGSAGPTVGLRADMDALPIQEANDCDYASERPGIMHACGHDVHVTMLLGAARLLKQQADAGNLKGSVRLIFQPAEEQMDASGKSGGRYMAEAGVTDGLAAIFALHVSPSVEAGRMSFVHGAINASSDNFEIHIHGQAAHGAQPHQGVDAIVASGAVVLAVQQIVSRKINPFSSGVVTIGTIQGGSAENVIASEVRMTGTLRALDSATRQTLKEGLARACQVAEAYGAKAELTIIEGYPVGSNNMALSEFAEAMIVRHFGADAIHPTFGPSMGAEDFSFMSALVPGALIRVGVKNPKWPEVKNLHTPGFQIDEQALPVGAAALAIFATEFLNKSA